VLAQRTFAQAFARLPNAAAMQKLAERLLPSMTWEECRYETPADGCDVAGAQNLEEVYAASASFPSGGTLAKTSLVVRCFERYGHVMLSVRLVATQPPSCQPVELLHFRCIDAWRVGHASLDRDRAEEVAEGLAMPREDAGLTMLVLLHVLRSPLVGRPCAAELPMGSEITYRGMDAVLDHVKHRCDAIWKSCGGHRHHDVKVPKLNSLAMYLTGPP